MHKRTFMAVLFGIGALCFTVTLVAWLGFQRFAVAGVLYGSAFFVLAAGIPYLDRQQERHPLCRACHREQRANPFGFCLYCGVNEPIRRPA